MEYNVKQYGPIVSTSANLLLSSKKVRFNTCSNSQVQWCTPIILVFRKAEAGGSRVGRQPELHGETLSQRKKKMLTEKHVEECSLFVTAKTWRETIMSFTY
jgi:hypothetical protein